LAQRSRKRGRRQRAPEEAAAAAAGGRAAGEMAATAEGRAAREMAAAAEGSAAGEMAATAEGSAAREMAAAATVTAELRSAREPATPTASTPPVGRSEARNAAVRASLKPLMPGERPGAITAGAVLCWLLGAGNLVAYVAGAKIAGKHPAAGGIVIFSALMIALGVGVWRMWYGAVLALMVVLAIVVALFSLLWLEASNVLGYIVPPLIIGGAGFLFVKLVRALSRIQMPRPPGR